MSFFDPSITTKNITQTDTPSNPTRANSPKLKLFVRLIAGDADAYWELLTDHADEDLYVYKKDKTTKIHIADVKPAKEGGPEDALYLDLVQLGGDDSKDGSLYQVRLTYRDRTQRKGAPAQKSIKNTMDEDITDWRDPFLSYGEFTSLARTMGWTTEPSRRSLYKRFLLRLWRACQPQAALPLPKGMVKESSKRDAASSSHPVETPVRKRKKLETKAAGKANGAPLDDDEETRTSILQHWAVVNEEALFRKVDKEPSLALFDLDDRMLLIMVTEGMELAIGDETGASPMSPQQLKNAIEEAVDQGIDITQTGEYGIWLQGSVSGTKGKVEIEQIDSLQTRAEKKRAEAAKNGAVLDDDDGKSTESSENGDVNDEDIDNVSAGVENGGLEVQSSDDDFDFNC